MKAPSTATPYTETIAIARISIMATSTLTKASGRQVSFRGHCPPLGKCRSRTDRPGTPSASFPAESAGSAEKKSANAKTRRISIPPVVATKTSHRTIYRTPPAVGLRQDHLFRRAQPSNPDGQLRCTCRDMQRQGLPGVVAHLAGIAFHEQRPWIGRIASHESAGESDEAQRADRSAVHGLPSRARVG